MKKRLVLMMALGFMTLGPSVALADSGSPSKGRFILGISGGTAVPMDGFGSSYNIAYAGQLTIGYAVDDNLSFFLASQSCIFQTNILGVDLTEFALVPTVKYAFGDNSFKPYLTGGMGYNNSIFHVGNSSTSQSDFVLQGGAGIQFPLGQKIDLFVEGKYTHVFASSTVSYLPIRAGVNFDL